MNPRYRAILAQWGRVAFLASVGVLAFETALPMAWRFGYSGPDWPFSGPAPSFLLVLTITLLLFLAVEPIRIRKGHWRYLVAYPPLWLAVVAALVTVALIDGYVPRSWADRPTWNDSRTLVPIGLSLLIAVALRQLPVRRYKPLRQLNTATEITWHEIARWLASGEQALEPDEIDFFHHREIARRVAEDLRRGSSVALIGPYGSGKTGVVNAVRTDLLSGYDQLFVFAELNAWAIGKSKDAPRVALDRIITALEDYADMQKFRAMPVTYRRLADAEPTGRLAKLIGPTQEGDPIDQIQRLTPLLDALNARVVLVIEDLERAEEAGFRSRHLQRFLWAIHDTPRITFLIAYAV